MGEKGLHFAPQDSWGRENCRQDAGPGVCLPSAGSGRGLLRPNSRVGGGQTTQPWVSPDTVPPFRLVGTSLELQRSTLGPEQGCTPPLAAGDPPRARSGLCRSALRHSLLVRKSFKLAVEEWKVGNQTGSFLEGAPFFLFVMVFLIITTITVVSSFVTVLVLFFLPSQRIHSFQHIPRLFFSCLSPHSLGTFGWGGWSRMGGRGPQGSSSEEGSSVSL